MIEVINTTVEVKIKNGLHARPAGELVKSIKPFKSDVFLIKDEKKVNLKSIIQLMSVAIKENEHVQVIVDGEDESEVMSVINHFFNQND